MSFSVTATIPPVTGMTATAGVQSVVLKWDAPTGFDSDPDSYYEVWSHTSNTFASATKIQNTTDNKFTHTGLTAVVTRYYWIRVAKKLASGDIKFSATVAASAVPTRATLGTGQVTTINVASGAITGRVLFEDTGVEWVRTGLDRDGYVSPPGDQEHFYDSIAFTGVGEYIVVTIKVQSNGGDIYYRSQGSVAAYIQAQIQDHDNPLVPVGVTGMNITIPVTGLQASVMPINPSQFFTMGMDRDFQHTFVLQPVTGKSYRLLMRVWVTTDEAQNYIYYESLYRHVQFDIYYR